MTSPENKWLGIPVVRPNDEGCRFCHYQYTIGTEGCWDCRCHDNWAPMTDKDKLPHCAGCAHVAEEIEEYVDAANELGVTPSAFVILEEGTYNPASNKFWCTSCYIRFGQPKGLAP